MGLGVGHQVLLPSLSCGWENVVAVSDRLLAVCVKRASLEPRAKVNKGNVQLSGGTVGCSLHLATPMRAHTRAHTHTSMQL